MALPARLSAPLPEPRDWPWHHAKWTSLPASLLTSGDRRMEAEGYLAGGYGVRVKMEARKSGWTRLGRVATVWQPSRLKGIQVFPEFGTPFLAATQVFDLRPVPRKFLSLERTSNAAGRYVHNGQILVTCSGNVGRATLAHKPHENTLISHDLLRVDPQHQQGWGWLYAYLRSPQARAMMSAAQYGHVIKHLEVAHLEALPVPVLRDALLEDFNGMVNAALDHRNHAHQLSLAAEIRFEQNFGPFAVSDKGEVGFSVQASTALFSCRRRFDALPHNPMIKDIRLHLSKNAKSFTKLADAGFDVWLPTRFKRIPVVDGVPLLDSSDLFEINPDITKHIADGNFGDAHNARVKKGWLLLARSGQIYGLNGTLTLATEAHEDQVVSDHIIRIAPSGEPNIRLGYLYVALSHPVLGRPIMKSLPYGSSIPEIEVADVEQLEIVRINPDDEEAISDMAEEASALRAEADQLENALTAEAESLIDRFLAGGSEEFLLVPPG